VENQPAVRICSCGAEMKHREDLHPTAWQCLRCKRIMNMKVGG
jgi:hypothetical protein